jgi:hypothetical protein
MRAQPVHPPGVARRLRSAGQRRIDPRRKGEDAMLKTIIRTTACLTLSAAAFIVITKMDATAAKSRSPSAPEASEPKPAPRKPAPPAPAPPAPKLTTASLVLPAKTTPSTSTAATKGDETAAAPLPNWKGKRLSLARREARNLGLKVTAVDESGETVPAPMAGIYRVRRQLAQTDTAVQFVVREIVDTAAGY